MSSWTREWVEGTAPALEDQGARSLLRWALDRLGPEKVVFACSFGVEDMVLLDLCHELRRMPRVVTLDTGRLPQETYETMQAARARYGARVELLCPDPRELQEMTAAHGPNLFYQSVELRKLCCRVRKLAPLRRALEGAALWIVGLRRGQSAERALTPKLSWDEEFGLAKLAPIADWDEAALWERVSARRVPYNRLHDQGFPSVGCAPCTRAVRPGEDARAGRWWWERPSAGKECGLHER